jgi:hypothetical protein
MSDSDNNYGSEKSIVQRLIRLPASQEERISSASLGMISVVSAGAILLLKGITSLVLPGFLISAVLGTLAWWIYRKDSKWKPVAAVIGSVSLVSLLNAIPAFRPAGGFILAAGAVLTAGFGLWKLGSVIYSIFMKER